MSARRAYLLLLLLSAYYFIHWAQEHLAGPEWVRFYAKDLLFIPTLMLAVQGAGMLGGKVFQSGFRQIMLATVYSILVFEVFLPVFSERYAGDWKDALAYATGALCMLSLQFAGSAARRNRRYQSDLNQSAKPLSDGLWQQ